MYECRVVRLRKRAEDYNVLITDIDGCKAVTIL